MSISACFSLKNTRYAGRCVRMIRTGNDFGMLFGFGQEQVNSAHGCL